MQPQENFYYYEPSTRQCINFPYTGACRSINSAYGYDNVFYSYKDCMVSSSQEQHQGYMIPPSYGYAVQPPPNYAADYHFPEYAPGITSFDG